MCVSNDVTDVTMVTDYPRMTPALPAAAAGVLEEFLVVLIFHRHNMDYCGYSIPITQLRSHDHLVAYHGITIIPYMVYILYSGHRSDV